MATFSTPTSFVPAVTATHFVKIAPSAGAGTIAHNRDGILLTSDAAGADCLGLYPLGSSALLAANFIKTTDVASLEVDIKTPASLTAIEYLIGFVAADLTDAGGVITKDLIGEYNNLENTQGAWFWFDKATQNTWCVGYRDAFAGVDVAKSALTAETVAVSTAYTLKVELNAGSPKFWIDGVLKHTATAVLAAAAVIPVIYVIGNAKTLYVRNALVSKTY